MMELFRRQVGETKREDGLGRINLVTARMGWPAAILAASLATVIIAFLTLGGYTRSEQVSGHLVPGDGLVTISAPVTGMVVQTLVAEGQYVQAGQALLEISTEKDSPVVGKVGAAVALELDRQRWRLENELAGLDRVAEREESDLRHELDFLSRQLELRSSEVVIRQQRAESAHELLERVQPLVETGQLNRLQYEQYRSNMSDSEVQLNVAQQQQLVNEREYAALRRKLQRLPSRITARRHEIEHALTELAMENAVNEGQRATIVRAPSPGRVSGLTVSSGQSVAEGRDLLAVIPQESDLVAELWVPASAIGLIEPGQRVAMRYHAYPYQSFGYQYGKVVEVASRALHQDEIRRRTGLEAEAPAYRVLARPDSQEVRNGQSVYELHASMTLDAALLLHHQRLFDFPGLSRRSGSPLDPASDSELGGLNGERP